MMVPMKVNKMGRGTGKTRTVLSIMDNVKLKSTIVLVPNLGMKRYILHDKPSMNNRIFTFDEFLEPGFPHGLDLKLTRVLIDEGLNQDEEYMFGVMWKLGHMGLSVDIFGTPQYMLNDHKYSEMIAKRGSGIKW